MFGIICPFMNNEFINEQWLVSGYLKKASSSMLASHREVHPGNFIYEEKG